MQRLLAIASLVLAVLIIDTNEVKWDGLKATWGPDIKNPNYFVDLPRTTEEAVSKGYEKIDHFCWKWKWRGIRYVKDSDYSVVLLYDINGYIAGIQSEIPKVRNSAYPSVKQRPPFVSYLNSWILTAYFTDPCSICTTGRSKEDFTRNGTGTDLYIQNGTTPSHLIKIPNNISGLQGTIWKGEKCFPTMGKHFWYDLREDLSCDSTFPAFFMYNGGELTAFGWAFQVNLTSPRYEHPPVKSLSNFMDPVPKCLSETGVFSSMHIFLTADVSLNKC